MWSFSDHFGDDNGPIGWPIKLDQSLPQNSKLQCFENCFEIGHSDGWHKKNGHTPARNGSSCIVYTCPYPVLKSIEQRQNCISNSSHVGITMRIFLSDTFTQSAFCFLYTNRFIWHHMNVHRPAPNVYDNIVHAYFLY